MNEAPHWGYSNRVFKSGPDALQTSSLGPSNVLAHSLTVIEAHIHPPWGGYCYPFYRWEDWGLERLSELLNITQLTAVVFGGGGAWLWEPKVVLLQSPLPLSYTMMPPIMQWGFQWETDFFSFFYSKSRSLLFILRGREKKRTDNATGKTILAICIHTSCPHFP